jgi:DNA repair protein RecN (Recombination protein N)
MLSQLNITNFAIIKHLEISLESGLNTLSGETGAGKSIIINAINLVLGGRAHGDLIRSGCKEARVEALFNFPEGRLPAGLLQDFGISFDGELLISRSIFREGRNRILINGSMATVQMLSKLGPFIISISGQHEHQLLLRPENHLYLLDEFGGLSEERQELSRLYTRFQEIKGRIRGIEQSLKENEKSRELHAFQFEEIEGANIGPGEDAVLEREKERLQHSEQLLELASAGYDSLYENENSVISSLSRLTRQMEKMSHLDEGLSAMASSLSEVMARLEDVSFEMRDFKESIPLDHNRLEEVLDRLELLGRLKKKYGGSLEEVMKYRERLCSWLDDSRVQEHDLPGLRKGLEECAEKILKKADRLSGKRRDAARIFQHSVEGELKQLHMKDALFRVRFHEGPAEGDDKEALIGSLFGPEGLDRLEFIISPNPGEQMRPLSKIASGGELSRIMLAVKTILATNASVETLIFDEVDSGISGATAEVVGEKLFSLSEFHQIICITHLPQIASKGKCHFLVNKEVAQGRTITSISRLDPESRVMEIARLLAGKEVSTHALAHARDMLNS